jgi:hypothetical protein
MSLFLLVFMVALLAGFIFLCLCVALVGFVFLCLCFGFCLLLFRFHHVRGEVHA